MSDQQRPVETTVTICDLCGEILPEHAGDEKGSLTRGWIAHPVNIPKTKRAWLHWPPGNRERLGWEERQKPENKPRHYDFHADCILQLVEANLTHKPKESA